MPTTLVGLYLCAGALREHERRRELREMLRATRWHDAEAVAKAAFEIAVREAQGPGTTPAAPEKMAAGLRAFFGTDGVDRIPEATATRLIRAAIGEDVAVDDIPLALAFTIHALVFVGLALDLGYDRSKLHAVLRQAEEMARASGHSPTMA